MVNMDILGDLKEDVIKISRPQQHERANYSNLSQKFKDAPPDFKKQFCKIYSIRLERMYQLLKDRIEWKWGKKYPVIKVHKLQEESNKKCVVIGTLFKDQKLKPSVLKRISEVNSLIPQPIYTHFADDSDQLFIEDDLQRYQIFGNIDVQKLVTGISCALLGSTQGNAKFLVEDYCFVQCRPQVDRPLGLQESFVCILSGLDLINYEKVIGPLKLCVDYIMGFVGDENSVSKIRRMIIAGNSVRTEAEAKKEAVETKVVVPQGNLEAVKKLDLIISQFSRVMDVDLMPGAYDPSNHLLSQQPMHRCMFPLASQFEGFSSVSNPYECEIDGVRFLGSSGQPVTDVLNYSRIEDPIEALEQCLVWGHISPTAPDTLGCYPYYDKDPFIIEDCPHVFFTGNQPEFQTKIHKGTEGQEVRLICVPQFTKSASINFINLKTLDCYDMIFETFDMS